MVQLGAKWGSLEVSIEILKSQYDHLNSRFEVLLEDKRAFAVESRVADALG